jgi:EAL domain-containing protein (putative c-di-GMP-specific phosphodiesterase class I)
VSVAGASAGGCDVSPEPVSATGPSLPVPVSPVPVPVSEPELDPEPSDAASVSSSPPLLELEQPAAARDVPIPTSTTTWKSFFDGLSCFMPDNYHVSSWEQPRPPSGIVDIAMDGERRDTAQVQAQTVAAGRRCVLLVDDDEALARVLDRLLRSAGYDVVLAPDGASAVQLIMSRPFDVVLSDIQMPGMSGVELLGIVRAYDLYVPVILMTGEPTLKTAMEAISLGALQYLAKPTPNDVLLKAVERASRLHRMAQMKRDALRLAGEEDTLAGDRAGLLARLHSALGSLTLAFQPIIDDRKRRIFGYEALMRSKEASLPHPGAVLKAAERLDRLPDVGRRVRALAADALERAPSGTQLFVNLHTRDLLDAELYEANAPLTRFADRVVLEITERVAIDDVKDIQARVSVLRYNGYRIAIDDLGAGYAGLSSFAALEPEIVKLDMSLVRNAHLSDVRRRLIGSMTSLCKEMGMLVVAEGIETAEELSAVQLAGCELLQGYLFAKPGPPFPRVEGMS